MRRKSVVTLVRGGNGIFFFGKYVLHCYGIDPFVTLMGILIADPFYVTTSFLLF